MDRIVVRLSQNITDFFIQIMTFEVHGETSLNDSEEKLGHIKIRPLLAQWNTVNFM